jgi:uncharacterized protein YjbI with pentapeptide repeats
MANSEHLEILKQGIEVWNAWRTKEPLIVPDLRGAKLSGAMFARANFSGVGPQPGAIFAGRTSARPNSGRRTSGGADLEGANLSHARLRSVILFGAKLCKANLQRAYLFRAYLDGVDLRGANLSGADLWRAHLWEADLRGTNHCGSDLGGANLTRADLGKATLRGANLSRVVLVETNLADTTLVGCRIYGASAWNVKLTEETKQQDLIISADDEHEVTGQFVYLLLHNKKIRDVIDTVGNKGVLLLGRFTEGRIELLNRLREELRSRGYLPIVFNFDKPETKDFTETVRLLAGAVQVRNRRHGLREQDQRAGREAQLA